MTILIDSNVMIDFLKGKEEVVNQFNQFISQKIPIFISTISIYEVYMGIIANLYVKAGRPSKVPELLKGYSQFLLKCNVLSFTREAAEKAADIYAQAQGKGITIKEKDCQIAGIALVHGILIVYTRDEYDFSKIYNISGLKYTSYLTNSP